MNMKLVFFILALFFPLFALSETLEVKIEGMTCGGCERMIEGKIKTLPGVQSVKADHSEGKALIVLKEDSHLASQEIEKAVKAAGKSYSMKEVKVLK